MRHRRRTRQLACIMALIAVTGGRSPAQVATSFNTANVSTTPRIRVGQILPERNATVSISTRVSGDKLGGPSTTDNSILQEAVEAEQQFFKTFQTGVTRTPKVGGTQGRLRVSTPLRPKVLLPLFERRGRLADAELKLGRLYLDLFTLSGSVLYSDNVNRSYNRRDGAAIGIVRLQGALIFQISETMRLAAGGTLAWLPFKNEIGFRDPLANFTASIRPIFLTQFNYDVPLGPLTTFTVFDRLNVVSGGFGQSRAFDALQRDVNDLVDREGRRRFIQRQSRTDVNRRFREGFSINNTVGAGVDTLLPTETRLATSFFRRNLWYAQGAPGQASSQDTWRFSARNERENMRFKPEITYQARHQNNRPGYDQTIRAGVTGPISDYIDFTGGAGILLSGFSNSKRFIYRLGLLHRLRELTTHSVTLTRQTTFPTAQVVTMLSYRLQQILSPDWTFDFGYEHRLFEPIDNPGNFLGQVGDQIEGRFGVRITDRFRALAGYSYRRLVNRRAGAQRFDSHVYRLELVYAHTDVTESSILYQFERRLSNFLSNTFDENVVTYTLSREF